jgi:hypothetical protein
MSYLTVYNRLTRHSVPFYRNQFDEIVLNSLRPEDTEDNCIVKITEMFHTYSLDLEQTKKV